MKELFQATPYILNNNTLLRRMSCLKVFIPHITPISSKTKPTKCNILVSAAAIVCQKMIPAIWDHQRFWAKQ